MIGIYNYTVLFTLFGTISGVAGILEISKGNITGAMLCLMLSGFFDMFDGTIARTKQNRTEFEKKYGIQLDSLSDVICFGVLPLTIALHVTSSLGTISNLCIIYLITSISRLAYFNVEEEMRTKKENTPRKTYTGLPVTASALIIPVLYLTKFLVPTHFAIVFLIGFLMISIFQISKIKLPHFNLKGLLICLVFGILVWITFLTLQSR